MQAIRRLTICATLTLVLVGSWLRQAEAADALARSLAELAAPGVIETADSPDGDGLGVRAIKADANPGLGWGVVHLRESAFLFPLSHFPIPSALAISNEPGASPWSFDPPSRRLARLQVFLN